MLLVSSYGRPARADASLDGKWRQSALREDFTVQRWQTGCGPPPRSSSTGGGETISVRAEGDVLSFVGAGRVYRSNQCYDPLPSLQRESYSHAAQSRQWRTRCTTPPGDPRKTTMQTLVVATSDTHIDVTETGRYEIAHEDGLCIADVRRSRSFDLVQSDAPAAPASVVPSAAPTPPPTHTPPTPQVPKEDPKPSSSCTTPGPAARLEARPSKKLLRPGEAFTFRAKVVDKEGCPLSNEVKWSASKDALAAHLTVDAKGHVTVPEGVPEGDYGLEANADGKTTHVTVAISTAANYDALLVKDGLNSAGETDTASVTSFPGVSLGSSEVAAEDGRKTRRAIFIGIIGTLVVALGIAYLVLRRRQSRAQALEAETLNRYEDRVRETSARNDATDAEYLAQKQAHENSVRIAEEAKHKLAQARAERAQTAAVASAAAGAPMNETRTCPTCNRSFSNTFFCPEDGSKLSDKPGEDPLGTSLMCSTCKRTFPEGTTVCPEHGVDLRPLGTSTDRPPPVKAARGKICPSCGARFDGAATFCGKDGTSLVLLN